MYSMEIESLLVVAAHPDDEILGCGGTVSKLSKAGVECHCLILSQGILSRHETWSDLAISQIQELKSQVEKAANLIGFSSVKQFDFPDNQFDSQPLLSITKAIEDTIKDKRPDTVLAHHSGDLNLDHSVK